MKLVMFATVLLDRLDARPGGDIGGDDALLGLAVADDPLVPLSTSEDT